MTSHFFEKTTLVTYKTVLWGLSQDVTIQPSPSLITKVVLIMALEVLEMIVTYI